MTLIETEAPRLLNGARVLLPPPAAPVQTTPGGVTVRAPPRLGRGLLNYDGTARRFMTDAELAVLQAEARRHYEGTTLPVAQIAYRLDVRYRTIWQWAKRFGWTRPAGAPRGTVYVQPPKPTVDKKKERRAAFVQRLYAVFERQTSDLEARAVDPLGRTDEKDARTLSVLAKALETLIALDRDDDGASPSDTPEPADRGQFNAELAERLRRWAERGAPVDGPEPVADSRRD